jgi:substrate import-associated zinc metallohydrolase lipoprotein
MAMKQLVKYTFTGFMAAMLLAGCRKNSIDTSYPINGLGGDTWVKGPIDQWIYDSLTVPFNIEVLYKWDQFQDGDITKTLVPPEESKVIPLLATIKRIWIEPYVKAGGLTFVKKMTPKQIALVGSPSYNSNGSITLGEAEGGKKILLYTVNDFTLTDREAIKRRMRTIQHEFAHILHQTILFTPDYERITAADYTGDWTNQSAATALSKGFITPYSMSAKEEDFAEMVAHMLMEGPEGFDQLVNTSTTAAGIAALQKKKAIIIAYFKSAWNIDLPALQRYVQQALDAIVPAPALHLSLGNNKLYRSIRFTNNGTFKQTSKRFEDSLIKANNLLKAFGGNAGRYIDSIILAFPNPDTMIFRVKYINPASGGNFVADFRFKFTSNAAGEWTFGAVNIQNGRSTADNNAEVIKATMTPITDFIGGKIFIAKWPLGKPDWTIPLREGGLYLKGDDTVYILGQLNIGIN